MAYVRSTKNVRSLRSIRSSKSVLEQASREETKRDGDIHSFDSMLVMACERFHCPFSVTVKKEVREEFYRNLRQSRCSTVRLGRMSIIKKATLPVEPVVPVVAVELAKSSSRTVSLASGDTDSSKRLPATIVTLVYDKYNTLTEILLKNVMDVPRSLLQIFRVLIPYYRTLTRITVSRCRIDMYTIYELSKILYDSTITELCLDGSPVSGSDYTLLLETTKLRSLSLCRCNIQDDACKLLSVKLQYAGSAQKLLVLNLSSNRITDEGAKHISNALRTNRCLRYLNLSDNHITDSGAGQILDMLIEFPLTYDEILHSRQKRLEYSKRRNDLFEKHLDELSILQRKGVVRKRRTIILNPLGSIGSARRDKDVHSNTDDDNLKAEAEILTTEVLGPFDDPYHPKTTKSIESYVYSVGNLTLAYLNLAYNNLSYMSVRKLQNVIEYQNNYKNKGGLVKVVIEGNNLPISCPEFTAIDKLLGKSGNKMSENVVKAKRVEKC